MKNVNDGRAWSDERYRMRCELRTAIDQIVASMENTVLTSDDVTHLILEVAVAQYAWGEDPAEAARQIARLAHRVRAGEQLEF